MIKEEVGGGADVNAQNKLGQTPLHIAYIHGNIGAALLPIKWGADIKIHDNEGKHGDFAESTAGLGWPIRLSETTSPPRRS